VDSFLRNLPMPLVVIAGPTGIGKTQVALELAELFDGEIIGADSMQIYRRMDIGTAKPTPAEQMRVPHHLIDLRNPDEDYSAADYARDAAATIRAVQARGKLPLLVGGTGLYIDAVLSGIFAGPGRDDALRQTLHTQIATQGKLAVYQQLEAVDAATARRLHPNDVARVIRALEVYNLTGMPISTHQATATAPIAQFDACLIGLTTAREVLYQRIDRRVEQMLEDGLIAEVAGLLQQGYHAELKPLKSLGYKEIVGFLAGEFDRAAAVTLIQRNTRRYAKRQLTWFRKYAAMSWISRSCDERAPAPTVAQCVQVIRRHAAQTASPAGLV